MKSALVLVALAICICTVSAGNFSFASIGDWGCEPIGGWHAQDEVITAKAFAQTAGQVNARFILNPGDNFYYCGVKAKDDAMWNATFENIFSEPSTMVNWYNALGNHDYGYPTSAESQINYKSPNGDRWKMPGRYYYERLVFPGEVNISLVVLDASPCQSEYISSNPSGWDPCGSVIPGCPGCTFHQNVVAQSCAAQLQWLQKIVQTIPDGDWKVAMIHAPAMDIDVEDLITPLQKANFDLVVNGHVHLLAHYTIDGNGTYITSGAGCMVKIENKDDKDDLNASVKYPRAPGQPKLRSLRQLSSTSCTRSSSFHNCQIVWQDTVAGYTTHTFDQEFKTLTTNILNYEGQLLHTAVTTKGGGIAPSPPGPNPGPNPGPGPSPWTPSPWSPPGPKPPAGTCCFYSDKECHSGQTCCNDEGYSYHDYECKHGSGKRHYCKWENDKCIVP